MFPIKIFRLGLVCCAAMAASCMSGPEEGGTFFRLEANPDLVSYQKVTILLGDSLGNLKATLYDDTLPDMARLEHLPAGPYRGGAALITILAYRDGRLAYRETRQYDGETQQIVAIEVFRDSAVVALPPIGPAKPSGHAPTLPIFPGDTLVTIRDSVPLNAEAADADADLAGYAWDCNGDGRPEDSAALDGSRSKIRFGRIYADSGTRVCILKVWDKTGAAVQGKVAIHVITDPPTARAGKDTTVVVETPILLHAMGEDGRGPVISREWKIGGGDFTPVPQTETTQKAPAVPQDLVCILRITDSDSQSTLDTLMVKVIYNPDNTLSDLRANKGKLEPAFKKDVRNYLITVGAQDSLISLLPIVNEPHAHAAVTGADFSGTVPVAPGDNSFPIQVTAQDGSTLQYIVTVRR